MARKRKDSEDEFDFKVPEFDEEEFLRKEARDTRAVYVTIGFACLVALGSFALTLAGQFLLGLLVGFICLVLLRHIYPLANIDTSTLEKKNWAGNFLMYLATWIAIWILLLNPPISDIAGPSVHSVEVFGVDSQGNWTLVSTPATNCTVIAYGENVSLVITAVDNTGVTSISALVSGPFGVEYDQTPPATDPDNYLELTGYGTGTDRNRRVVDRQLRVFGNNMYTVTFIPQAPGRYRVNTTVGDASGHVSRSASDFCVASKPSITDVGVWVNGTRVDIAVASSQVSAGSTVTINATVDDMYQEEERATVTITVNGVGHSMNYVDGRWGYTLSGVPAGTTQFYIWTQNKYGHTERSDVLSFTVG